MKLFILCFALTLGLNSALADIQVFPINAYHDPSITTLIFEDPYTGFLFKNSNRTIGNVAISIPLLSWGDGNDQLFLNTGVECSLRTEGMTFYSETLDLRVGMNWVHPFNSHWLTSVGLEHMSGHLVDDALEKQLEPLNMGIDSVPLRLVYHHENGIRAGLHLAVETGRSDPVSRYVFGGIFAEYHFYTDTSSAKTPTDGPYIGTNIYYAENLNIGLSTTSEIGYEYHRMHFLLGYHSGADTRLKQEMFLNSTAYFWYSGLRYEI